MALPTLDEIEGLSMLAKLAGEKVQYEQAKSALRRFAEKHKGTAGKFFVSKHLKSAINTAAGSSGMIPFDTSGIGFSTNIHSPISSGSLHLGMHTASPVLGPIGSAVAPWIAALDVVRRAGDISDLYDVLRCANASATNVPYHCNCKECEVQIQYIIDKKERNVARTAVSVATFGMSALATEIYSKGKWLKSQLAGETRPKRLVSDKVANSAKAGCPTAIATILIVVSNWSSIRGGREGTMLRAAAIICSTDGGGVFSKEW